MGPLGQLFFICDDNYKKITILIISGPCHTGSLFATFSTSECRCDFGIFFVLSGNPKYRMGKEAN